MPDATTDMEKLVNGADSSMVGVDGEEPATDRAVMASALVVAKAIDRLTDKLETVHVALVVPAIDRLTDKLTDRLADIHVALITTRDRLESIEGMLVTMRETHANHLDRIGDQIQRAGASLDDISGQIADK